MEFFRTWHAGKRGGFGCDSGAVLALLTASGARLDPVRLVRAPVRPVILEYLDGTRTADVDINLSGDTTATVTAGWPRHSLPTN